MCWKTWKILDFWVPNDLPKRYSWYDCFVVQSQVIISDHPKTSYQKKCKKKCPFKSLYSIKTWNPNDPVIGKDLLLVGWSPKIRGKKKSSVEKPTPFGLHMKPLKRWWLKNLWCIYIHSIVLFFPCICIDIYIAIEVLHIYIYINCIHFSSTQLLKNKCGCSIFVLSL